MGEVTRLTDWIAGKRLFVLTGAGCSTESGLPDYRGPSGAWRHRKPMLISEFLRAEENRRHYWARNFLGWPRFSAASPGKAHHALRHLQQAGSIERLVTQNVDGLHDRAGSTEVIDLHGRSDRVICLSCRSVSSRAELQVRMRIDNPGFDSVDAAPLAPDADSDLSREVTASFIVPECESCGGILKPDVVFFGESVPKPVVEDAMSSLERSDAMLVVGSSLAVWSGYRFAVAARKLDIPVAAVNQGWTRADELLDLKIEARCGDVLDAVACAVRQ